MSSRSTVLAAVLLTMSACSAATRDAPGPGDSARRSTSAELLRPPSNAQRYSSDPLPPPIGHVNDFASVIPDSTSRTLESTLRRLRTTTEGEIVIVTFSDHAGFKVEEIARRIGNEWGIGARTGRARHAGTVILLIPKETSSDGRGYCRIELGEGANAFIPDSAATAICVAATPSFLSRDYGEALRQIAVELARRYTERFGPPP